MLTTYFFKVPFRKCGGVRKIQKGNHGTSPLITSAFSKNLLHLKIRCYPDKCFTGLVTAVIYLLPAEQLPPRQRRHRIESRSIPTGKRTARTRRRECWHIVCLRKEIHPV